MQDSENGIVMLILPLLIIILICVGVFLKKKNSIIRFSKIRDREKWSIEFLVDSISDGKIIDKTNAKVELMNIARILNVPVGLLRPDDVLEYLIGEDYFVGDSILEIEIRLNSLYGRKIYKPTIREIIIAFSPVPKSN